MDLLTSDETESYSAEETAAASRLFTEHYAQLISIARARRRRSEVGASLETVDLVHDSFLRLRKETWENERHFLAASALAMRHAVADHMRKKLAKKRSAPPEAWPEFGETPEQIVEITDLLASLGRTNPKWVRVVDARYFAGLTEAETAEALEMSPTTVRRHWKAAREWLAQHVV